jgi:sugar (glycoside-pentoside-hexuronide) transporter
MAKGQSPLGERASYGLYFLGQNIFYMLVVVFILPFCTDAGIPAAAVGAIMLAVRIFDAVNDPMFGAIVDNSHLKSGKFIPWLRISLVGIPLFTLLLFSVPSAMPMGMKIAWVATAYTLWSVSYTICDVPIMGIITAMTSDGHERVTLISIGRVLGIVGALVAMVLLPMVRRSMGGWFSTVLMLSATGFVTMVPICFTAKERVPVPPGQEKVTLGGLARFVMKNKYLLLLYGAVILAYGGNIGTSLTMYLARYNLQNEALMSLLSLAGFLPTLLLGFLMPLITRKVDKYHVILSCVTASIVLNIAGYFAGWENMTLFLILYFLRSIASGGIFMCLFLYTPDFAEYGRYKTGINASGVSFSLQTFTVKIISAISGGIGAAALSLIGFVEGEGAVQSAGFENKLWALNFLFPATLVLISVVPLCFYKLRDKYVAIMTRCNNGEISHEEAEALIGVKL